MLRWSTEPDAFFGQSPLAPYVLVIIEADQVVPNPRAVR